MTAETLTKSKFWVYDELASIDDDIRRELHDGEIHEMPSPTLEHQDILLRLATFISLWTQQHGGKAFLSPIDLYVSAARYYIPDLCFYSSSTLQIHPILRKTKRLTTPPDLIVEIVSPSSNRIDRVQKYRAYAEFGVRFYWIIDPEARVIQAFQWEENRFVDEAVMGDDETFSPQLFPGLTLNLGELFGPEDAVNL